MRMITPTYTTQPDHPDWQTVDSGLYQNGQQFDIDEPGYPVPDGCINRWRVMKAKNDYDETVWILQARRK